MFLHTRGGYANEHLDRRRLDWRSHAGRWENYQARNRRGSPAPGGDQSSSPASDCRHGRAGVGRRSASDADRPDRLIVVDTSVWIANLRDQPLAVVRRLRDPAITDDILVGDIVLTEVLQGARNDVHAAALENALRQFPVVAMVGDAIAAKAAYNY